MSDSSEDHYEKIPYDETGKWCYNERGKENEEEIQEEYFFENSKVKTLFSVACVLASLQVLLAVVMVLSLSIETARVREWLQRSYKTDNNTAERNITFMKERFVDTSELPSTRPNTTNRMGTLYDRIHKLNEKVTNLSLTFSDEVTSSIVQTKAFIFNSCSDVLSLSLPSGYYLVRTSGGSVVNMYCDVSLTCGGVKGGWARVINETFPHPINKCPLGFVLAYFYGMALCARAYTSPGCSVMRYPTNRLSYSRLCGKITGAQLRSSDGFTRYYNNRRFFNTMPLNSAYLDGISLTHGGFKRHIWSFAALHRYSKCSCSTDKPAFVSSHFSCDQDEVSSHILWDGLECPAHNKEWFYRNLIYSTSDDIEVRICRDEERQNEDIFIKTIEIFVQ